MKCYVVARTVYSMFCLIDVLERHVDLKGDVNLKWTVEFSYEFFRSSLDFDIDGLIISNQEI